MNSDDDDDEDEEEEEELQLPEASEDSESDSDSDVDPSTLIHEADLNKNKSKDSRGNTASTARKISRQDEAPAERDARTTFVGNCPVACATGKVGLHSSYTLSIHSADTVLLYPIFYSVLVRLAERKESPSQASDSFTT